MQRRAQRDNRDQRTKRLNRVLVCAAAVPVMLVAAGCSSESTPEGGDKSSASASASPSPTVRPAAFDTLPEPCDVLDEDTLHELTPKADESGKEGASDDVSARGSCSWSSLDNNGVDGSQFRWLNVSLLRFESDVSRGAGDERAKEYYAKQVRGAQAVPGAKNVKSEPASEVGDEATTVRYDLKKKEGVFKQQTVVARVENVVVTVDYNGAGLAGEDTPDVAKLVKGAEKAAREAMEAVRAANEADGAKGSAGTGRTGSPSTAAKSPSSSSSSSKTSQTAASKTKKP